MIVQIQIRDELPARFFEGVPPSSEAQARAVINQFRSRYPNASPENRQLFYSIVSQTIRDENRQMSRETQKIGEMISSGILTDRNLTLISSIMNKGHTMETVDHVAQFCSRFPNQSNMIRTIIESYTSQAYEVSANLIQIISEFNKNINRLNPIDRIEAQSLIKLQMERMNPNQIPQETQRIINRLSRALQAGGVEGLRFVSEPNINELVADGVIEDVLIDRTSLSGQILPPFTVERANQWMRTHEQFMSIRAEIRAKQEEEINISGNRLTQILGITEIGSIPRTKLLELERIATDQNRDLQSYLNQAQQMLRYLNLDDADPELRFNFAYGIATVGERVTVELYQRQRIVHFARYTQHTLEEVYDNINNPSGDPRPVCLLFMNQRADWNNAFYSQTQEIESLTRGHRLIIIETNSDEGFIRGWNETARALGPIRYWGIGGHASASMIQLGPNLDDSSATIDTTDLSRIQAQVRRRGLITSDAIGFILGCDSGNRRTREDMGPIAQRISRAVGGTVYAPTEQTGIIGFQFDNQQRVVRPIYVGETEQNRTIGERFVDGRVTRDASQIVPTRRAE